MNEIIAERSEPKRYIVFTDLDGTLIDFETYSPEIATPLAQQLIADGVPLVFCSSKTLEEQKSLMEQMSIETLCIVENGCGVFVPESSPLFKEAQNKRAIEGGGQLVELGVSSVEIRSEIERLSQSMRINFRPYSKLTITEISKITGLNSAAAERAQNRDFSETLTVGLPRELWNEVNAELHKVGLQCICGGRFYTVTSLQCNKGNAIVTTMDAYSRADSLERQSVGIGDSANDFDMLKTTDLSFLVQHPGGIWSQMDLPHLQRIPAIGPKGWIRAIESVFTTA